LDRPEKGLQLQRGSLGLGNQTLGKTYFSWENQLSDSIPQIGHQRAEKPYFKQSLTNPYHY
jgi:hypothetical protein